MNGEPEAGAEDSLASCEAGPQLVRALGLERSRLIALTGAGGKTTLMFALATAFAHSGETVLLTTTTKLAREQTLGPWPVVEAARPKDIVAAVVKNEAKLSGTAPWLMVHAGPGENRQKVLGIESAAVDELKAVTRIGRILVEADGSAGRPLKAPADHEPVIPATTDALVMVSGLNGLARPLSDTGVFRVQRWTELTGGAPGRLVTPQGLARVLSHPKGLARGCPPQARKTVFLNRADDSVAIRHAAEVARCLSYPETTGVDRVVAGGLLPEPQITASWLP